MLTHSKILVWYKVAAERVILGEAEIGGNRNLVSIWMDMPTESNDQGYGISLFGDDGRKIADKAISVLTADKLLIKSNEARVMT